MNHNDFFLTTTCRVCRLTIQMEKEEKKVIDLLSHTTSADNMVEVKARLDRYCAKIQQLKRRIANTTKGDCKTCANLFDKYCDEH